MIFVTLGTQNLEFRRILDYLENSHVKDEIIVQAGCTKYSSGSMKIYDYLDKETFDNYIKKADYIICHSGVGTIVNSLKLKKKVLTVPRLAKYHEHHNDHQVQIASVYEAKGYILMMRDGDDFDKKFQELERFVPKDFVSNNENFVSRLKEYIENC